MAPSAEPLAAKPRPRRRGADSLALSLQPLQRAGMPLGLALSTLPVLLGIVLHLRATYVGWPLPDGQPYTVGWLYVAAMLITAVACRIGAHLYRHTRPLAVGDLHLRHRGGHAGRRRRAALGPRHQELGQAGTGADGHPDPVCDRGAALSRPLPGKPAWSGPARPPRP